MHLGKLVSLAFIIATTLVAQESTTRRPDILFILTDDQTFQAVHALGNREIETPHLDRLVKSGTTFTRAYNMGSWVGAVCVASRTMLISGRTLWRASALPKNLSSEEQDGRLWPQLIKQAGYTTYFTGKWHTGSRPERVFDVTGHVRGGMPAQTPEGYNRPIDGQNDPWSSSDPKFGGFWEGGKHWSEVLADEGVGFIDRAAQKPEPFFIYLAFNAPHDPRQAPETFLQRYARAELKTPASFVPEYPHGDAIAAGRKSRDEQLGPFPRTATAVRTHRREYFACVTHLDEQVGRIMAALQKSGRAANTFIFFTSDHGLAIGNHGLLGKQNMFDHSVRVPLVVIGPGVGADRRIDSPVYMQDVMPTTLQLSGQAVPEHVEFRSLLPLLRGEADSRGRNAIYGAFRDLQRAVSAEGHKLILYPTIPKALLFDLRRDPHEIDDLSVQPKNRALMKRLFAELIRLQREMDDPLDLRAAFPDLH